MAEDGLASSDGWYVIRYISSGVKVTFAKEIEIMSGPYSDISEARENQQDHYVMYIKFPVGKFLVEASIEAGSEGD